MTTIDLRNAGEALFGARWQRELARALGTNHRQVAFWLTGERRMPLNLADRLDALLIARLTALVAARRELQRALRRAA